MPSLVARSGNGMDTDPDPQNTFSVVFPNLYIYVSTYVYVL